MMSGIPRQNQLPLEYGEAFITGSTNTTYQNNTLNFVLVVGMNLTNALVVDGDYVEVLNSAGKILSITILAHIGTAGSELQLMPVKLLVPPGGYVRGTHNFTVQFISFPTLESLRGFI